MFLEPFDDCFQCPLLEGSFTSKLEDMHRFQVYMDVTGVAHILRKHAFSALMMTVRASSLAMAASLAHLAVSMLASFASCSAAST